MTTTSWLRNAGRDAPLTRGLAVMERAAWRAKCALEVICSPRPMPPPATGARLVALYDYAATVGSSTTVPD